MVAPTGNSVCDAWEAALAGRSAIARISRFDPTGLPVQIAAEVRGFDPTTVMGPKEARQSSRFVQFAAGASRQAIQDSGLISGGGVNPRYGCAIGVGLGGLDDIETGYDTLRTGGPRRVSPHLLPFLIPNMAAGFVAVAHGLGGPSFCMATACASGSHAIGEAFLHIGMGTADAMIAGGCEAATTPLLVAAFARMKALSTRNDDPVRASRPFDLDRDGFVIGEGAGIVVLEEYDSARRRGARIYAEMAGYGLSSDAHHITSPSPDGDGLRRAMNSALASGQIAMDQVDYINAHGTSTQANDASESAAIQEVFGEQARQISVSSTKSVTGHCLGGAGGIEAVYTVLALHHAIVPPTANYATPDPACALDYTPNVPRPRAIRCALSNSAGFGGQNACLAFKRFE